MPFQQNSEAVFEHVHSLIIFTITTYALSQIRKPTPGGAATIQTIQGQQLVKPVNLQGLQIIQQSGKSAQKIFDYKVACN